MNQSELIKKVGSSMYQQVNNIGYATAVQTLDLFPVFYSIMNWGFKHEKEIYEAKEDK